MKVLVTDSNTRLALYVIRSIGSRGIDVIAHLEKKYDNLKSFGSKSRYVNKKIVTSISPDLEQAHINNLSRIARNCDVIIPIKTSTIMAIAKNKHLFEGIGCLIPDFEQMRLAQNKYAICRRASKIGIPIPPTYFPESVDDAMNISSIVKYPVYIKLREEDDFRPKERYEIAFDPFQLITLYKRMHKRFPLPIIQERIKGVGVGFFALYDKNSQLIACFAHRRIRQYPYQGGPSSCCRSYKDTQVISQGIELLKSLHWKGLAMVEFIKDDIDGVPKLLEVNPRFWGSTPLAIAAGIDFPYLLFLASLEKRIEPHFNFKEGVKIRFLINDIMAFVDYLKHGKNRLDFCLQFFIDLIDFRIKDGIISFKDIKPSLAYVGMLLERNG